MESEGRSLAYHQAGRTTPVREARGAPRDRYWLHIALFLLTLAVVAISPAVVGAQQDGAPVGDADPAIHGILVQLPLPKHLNEERVLDLINIEKDADGIHPLNMGLLAMRGREPLFTPATPTGSTTR